MKPMREDATTAEWVQARIDEILSGFDDDAVGRTMPVLVLMLADAYGPSELDPDMQDALRRIGERIGLDDDMPAAEVEALTLAYVEGRDADETLLASVKAVLQAHADAVEAKQRRSRRRLDLGFASPARRLAAEAPVGTPSSRFAAETCGRIFVR